MAQTKPDKLLALIEKLYPKPDKDWLPDLRTINLLDEPVLELYDIYERREANIILAYIVFAYHAKSPWLQSHKDRDECKRKIMETLCRKKPPEEDSVLIDIVSGMNPQAREITKKLVAWIMDYLKDTRWRAIEANLTYISLVNRMAFDVTDDAKKALDIGRCLAQRSILQKETNAMIAEVERDFLELDNALEQEGHEKITHDFTWEGRKRYLASLKSQAQE
ncbi:hypothetical protein PV783_34275 [Chitinophaga sp. CC14]|uniref:hypothetical protein n=1 Tax=Chitinophaga sp. CC14 TaxID=3029199 RepID=UPI003B7ED8E7